MAVRIQFRRGTAAEWTAANPTLAAGELGYEVDTAQIKIGNGTSTWTSLPYSAVSASYIDNAIANVVGLSPESLDTLNELAAAINDDASFFSTVANNIANAESNAIEYTNEQITLHNTTTNVHGISDTTELVYNSTLETYATILYADEAILDHNNAITNVHGIANTALLVDTSDLGLAIDNHNSDTTDVHGIANTANLVYQSEFSGHTGDTTSVHGISNTANLVYQSDLSSHIEDTVSVHGISDTANLVYSGDLSLHTSATTNVHGIADTADLVTTSSLGAALDDYAPLLSPSFTGTVVLPADTSIGDVSGTELGYLNSVTSNIQDQLDAKLATASANSIYAKLDGATFTGTVALTANTSIGTVDATEIGYLNGVTSGIQTQLDAKAPTANPTFTGTVSGVTKAMVGLGNVDNTTDLDKPVSNAVQTALNLKANIANPVFTGEVETADLTVTGNLYVQGSTTTVSAADLKLRDNMIYLNQAGMSTITGAVGDGTNVVYTTADAHGYEVTDYVTVSGVTPTSFNISGDGEEILAVTSNTFTVASTVTDTYTSGGTARGKVHFNPDLGWAAGRYDTVNGSGYAHAGLFRDATDGVFKFFDGYEPEPDESVFIDTAHNTFALADVAVADLKTNNAIVFADNTIQTSAGVPSLTTFTEKTSGYTLDTLTLQDSVVEMNSSSPMTFTIPTNATLAWPIGASMDILQTGTGQVTIANAVGVTLNFTPGNKLRTRWSSCTIMKRGTDSWILYGDLTA